MPFQSEKQRRYLWANEPEIARDWTDTYGSRIEAALGGIMRLAQGGRIGFRLGAAATGGMKGTSDRGMSTGDVSGGKSGNGGPATKDDRFRNYAVNPTPINTMGRRTEQPKGMFDNFNLRDFLPFGKYSLTGIATKGIKDIFGKFDTGWDTTMGPREDMGYNPNRVNPFSAPDRGGDGPYIPPYLNDVYAQNIMEEDDLDIDTSTANMEDWSQRFRVDDQYRQDKGALDPQIREYISKLYT